MNTNDTYNYFDMEPAEPEDVDEVCPDCGSKKMIRYMQQNGIDDYDWVYECLSCGTTLST